MSAKKDTRVPVTVLTGFLGAGKTTLLNHILNDPNHGMKFAIIENELGDETIDDKVLATKKTTTESVIEVMNGCICCSIRGDLTDALEDLYKKLKDFDGVIIETTGMADPGPVAQTFIAEKAISQKYRLDGIITVVDAKHLMLHIHEEKSEGAVNEAQQQLAYADRVLLNKTDLVTDETELKKLEAEIHAINPTAPITRCAHSKVDPKTLLMIHAFDLQKALKIDPTFLTEEQFVNHDRQVSSCSAKFEGELNITKLEQFISHTLESKGEDLFRYKGVLAVKGNEKKFVFQGVHMLWSGNFNQYDAQWSKGETRTCNFVFIGKNLDKKALIAGFMACKAKDKLRFKVGDQVLANTGGGPTGWVPGKVIKIWDEGNPYRIELKANRSNIWGPIDNDHYVRAPGNAPKDESKKQEANKDTAKKDTTKKETKGKNNKKKNKKKKGAGHSHGDHSHTVKLQADKPQAS